MTFEIRPFVEDDFPRVAQMRHEAFRQAVRPGPWLRGGGQVLTDDGRIVATTLVDPLGQFFGGRSVPSAAVSAVVVDPAYRGRGLSTRLLASVLAEQRSLGVPLSVLYPSIVGVYRRAGYEFAGTHNRYRLPVRSIPVARDTLPVRTWEDSDLAAIDAGYRETALHSAGQLDRSLDWWRERLLVQQPDRPVYRYCVGDDRSVRGHVIYTQQPIADREVYAYDVSVRDLSWATVDAARALLSLLAANQPFGRDVVWTGPLDEPLLTLFADVAPRTEWTFAFMLRVLDVAAALEARGYPATTTATIDLTVTDDVLPQNADSYRLCVADGRGTVERIARATPMLDAGALASLYSGWSSARSLAALGRLTGATESDLAALDACFAGPKPWMTEII